MKYYIDTSALVSVIAQEADAFRMRDWLDSNAGGSLIIGDWVETEFSAALSIKMRNRQIDQESRAAALGEFARLARESFEILPVLRSHFRAATRFANVPALGVRAGDALHLAIAADIGATIITYDRRMAEAAPVLGISARLLLD